MIHYLHWPEWAQYLFEGVLAFIELSCAAVVLTRAGKNPYWAFILLVPYVQVAAVAYLGFATWSPQNKTK